eukprot:3615016-Pleurochrysis_carterae.AAC.1
MLSRILPTVRNHSAIIVHASSASSVVALLAAPTTARTGARLLPQPLLATLPRLPPRPQAQQHRLQDRRERGARVSHLHVYCERATLTCLCVKLSHRDVASSP